MPAVGCVYMCEVEKARQEQDLKVCGAFSALRLLSGFGKLFGPPSSLVVDP